MVEGFLTHEILDEIGVDHGFGLRGSTARTPCARAVQVHGAALAHVVDGSGGLDRHEADAVLSNVPGAAVAVVTADCVPILAASADGRAVVAIHAGWRGLVAGVIEAGIAGLRSIAGVGAPLRAVVGPHIGACCYEVDAPVLEPLAERFAGVIGRATTRTRSGHARLALSVPALEALRCVGVELTAQLDPSLCTACDDRFESFRRDGAASGRLVHYVRPRG